MRAGGTREYPMKKTKKLRLHVHLHGVPLPVPVICER
jgi:hypothetical protein